MEGTQEGREGNKGKGEKGGRGHQVPKGRKVRGKG